MNILDTVHNFYIMKIFGYELIKIPRHKLNQFNLKLKIINEFTNTNSLYPHKLFIFIDFY